MDTWCAIVVALDVRLVFADGSGPPSCNDCMLSQVRKQWHSAFCPNVKPILECLKKYYFLNREPPFTRGCPGLCQPLSNVSYATVQCMKHGHEGLRVYTGGYTGRECAPRRFCRRWRAGNVNSAAARRHRFLGGCT